MDEEIQNVSFARLESLKLAVEWTSHIDVEMDTTSVIEIAEVFREYIIIK